MEMGETGRLFDSSTRARTLEKQKRLDTATLVKDIVCSTLLLYSLLAGRQNHHSCA
jgi:hypothetical protein